ncbi:hypothetical protein ACIA7S_28235 [Streptomyces sp. NPDC051643]|uniref:hypothetical protein n=1 Tax=Streptomyces sp. NPDC051643 TaxID=3365665 RepID=UPI0037A85AFF
MPYWLKQLLPLRYTSRYSVRGKRPGVILTYEARWRMWFGRIFAHERTLIGHGEEIIPFRH